MTKERFADNNLKFDKIDGKFSEWIENPVGKGVIARYEQFLLFPQSFQKTCTADTEKDENCLFGKQLTVLRRTSLENIERKGENAGF